MGMFDKEFEAKFSDYFNCKLSQCVDGYTSSREIEDGSVSDNKRQRRPRVHGTKPSHKMILVGVEPKERESQCAIKF